MLHVAVVGAGGHSELNHGPSLRDLSVPGEVELTAVCDLDRDKVVKYARAFGFARTYTSIHTMLRAESVDAIVAVTPVAATSQVVGELLPYGIPILLEKPPGRTFRESEALVATARSHGTSTMVSFNRRFVPAVKEAREWVERRPADGAPRLLVARMLRDSRHEEDFIIGTAIHLVDTALSFMGTPERITSHRRTSPTEGVSYDARISFADGRIALLVIEPDAGVDEETYELIGCGYSVQIDTLSNRVVIYEGGDRVLEWAADKDTPMHVMTGCLNETEAFLQAVAGNGTFVPTLADAAAALDVAASIGRGRFRSTTFRGGHDRADGCR